MIRQLDVFANPNARLGATIPYLLIIQASILDDLGTVCAAPLARVSPIKSPASLTPVFHILGENLTLLIHQIGALPPHLLTTPVASLAEQRDRVLRASTRSGPDIEEAA